MTLLGAKVAVEDRTNDGRIDAVIETDDTLYIFEFKVDDSAENALKQIEEKEYFKKYLLKKKPIMLVGVSFNTKERNISQWIKKSYSM